MRKLTSVGVGVGVAWRRRSAGAPSTDHDDLRAALDARHATVEALLAADTHAQGWVAAERVFQEMHRLGKVGAPDPVHLQALKDRLFESQLVALACPACGEHVIVAEGVLRLPTSDMPGDPDALREEIADLERRQVAHAEAQRLHASLRTMTLTLDRVHRGKDLLGPEGTARLTRERGLLDILRGREAAQPSLPGPVRRWVLGHGHAHLAALARARALRTRATQLQLVRKNLEVVFQSLPPVAGAASPTPITTTTTATVDQVFAAWWSDGGRRAALPGTQATVERAALAEYTPRPRMTQAQLKANHRLRELEAALARCRTELAAARAAPAPLLDMPPFPVYDALADAYFGATTAGDLKALNTAVGELANVAAAVVRRQAEFGAWHAVADATARAVEAAALATQLWPRVQELASESARQRDARARVDELAQRLPYLRRMAQLADQEAAAGGLQARARAARTLLDHALHTEAEMIDEAMLTLSTLVNNILQMLFASPATVEFSGFRTLKISKEVKPVFSIAFTYRGTTITDISTLSEGETTRLALAVHIACAKLNPFPFFGIDEALSTLDPELRHVVMDVIRAELAHKAVVIVLHDDTIGNFDNIVAIPQQSYCHFQVK